MMVMVLLFLALLFVAAVYFVRIYNGLISLRENVRKAWANIDVLLTQRHDELPKLVQKFSAIEDVITRSRTASGHVDGAGLATCDQAHGLR